MIDTSDRVTGRWRIAKAWAIMPPIEAPMMWADSMPAASSTAAASSAMSSIVYGGVSGSPESHWAVAAWRSTSCSWNRVERPTSRLSWRTT